jgi:hypothetical protein
MQCFTGSVTQEGTGESARKHPDRNNVSVQQWKGQILLGANILTPASDMNIREHILRV